jgi:2,2-dialkylglycine decarboxylase (pyruvate)
MKDFSFSARHRDLMARDEESVMGWRYEPRIMFERGRGVMIIDVDGNEYIDATAGMMCMSLGHSHPELTETIREQAGRLVHTSSWYSNEPSIEFAELIGSTLPGNLKVVNFAVTGSEANEIAMRMALAVTRKFDIVTVVRGLHGGSLAAEAMTTVAGPRRKGLGPFMMPAKANCIIPPFSFRAPPGCEENWDETSRKISEEMIEHTTSQEIAGILSETMMVAGGMIVPSNEWMKWLRKTADKWGALLILDEAQLAPGRTGKLWGFQNYDVTPDIVTFAKGMTAGMAICGAVTTPEIAEKSKGHAGLPWSGTYPHDPLPAAVALKQLQIVLRDKLVERAAALGKHMRPLLDRLKDDFEPVGDVRGMALYQMLDIVTDRKSRKPDFAMAERIRYYAALEGVIIICVKNFIRICPPLIITEAQIDDMVGRIRKAITRAQADTGRKVDFKQSSSLAAE